MLLPEPHSVPKTLCKTTDFFVQRYSTLQCRCPLLSKKYIQYFLFPFRDEWGLMRSMICPLSPSPLTLSPPTFSFAQSTPFCPYFWQEHSCIRAFALAVPPANGTDYSSLSVLTVHSRISFHFLMKPTLIPYVKIAISTNYPHSPLTALFYFSIFT